MFEGMVKVFFVGWFTGITLAVLIHLLGWASALVKWFGREGL